MRKRETYKKLMSLAEVKIKRITVVTWGEDTWPTGREVWEPPARFIC